jgi:hypothetical protein
MIALRFAAAAAIGFVSYMAVAPANALSMADCSVKYKSAQADGSLNGMKWNDFRKAKCSAGASASTTAATAPAADPSTEPTLANTANLAEPAAPTTKAPKNVSFPRGVSSQYASETPGKARLHTCLDQYKADKANNALNGMKWIQKGGGYYSVCNARLKG